MSSIVSPKHAFSPFATHLRKCFDWRVEHFVQGGRQCLN
jgi:hypothetical protein